MMLMQGVPPPSGDAWPWVAFVAVLGLAWIVGRAFGDKDKQIERCLTEVSMLRELASKRADKLEADLDRLRGERHA